MRTAKLSIHERACMGIERFLRFAPPGSDHLTVVLKSHLLIEEQLRVIVAAGLQDAAPIKGEKLPFGLAAKLAQAVTGELADPQLWPAISALSGIREAYSDRADPADMERRQAEFFSHGAANAMWKMSLTGERGASDFHALCSLLFGQLFALARVMEQTALARRASFEEATRDYDAGDAPELQAWLPARALRQLRVEVATERAFGGVQYFLTFRDPDGAVLPPIVTHPRPLESANAALIAAGFELLAQLRARGMAGPRYEPLPDQICDDRSPPGSD